MKKYNAKKQFNKTVIIFLFLLLKVGIGYA